MACATTTCLGAPSASKTVALSKEPRRPEMVNASPRAPLEAYASSSDVVPSSATAVPARGCPPQLFTSALSSEASFFSFSAFSFSAVGPLASKTVTSPPLLRRVAVATILPPTTSSSLASTPSFPSSPSFVSSFSASSLPKASSSPFFFVVVAGSSTSPSSMRRPSPRPAVISASTRSLTAASSVRPATTCIRSTPRVAVTFAARSSASKYLGNAAPDSTSATSSCVPPWMTCASAACSSSRSRHRGTRASMDAA